MNKQDNTSGWPLDMHQLKWALRHGQMIDGLENMVLTSQPNLPIGKNMENSMKNDSVADNISLHNKVLEEQIDKLGQSLNREIVSLKGEFAIEAQGTASEEQIDKLGQSLIQEILSLKSELAHVAQGTAVEEQIEQLGQSLNQEILALKNELANVVRGTAFEEQIDNLGQTLNQEILSLKSELTIIAQGTAFEEQIGKLGKYHSQEILSLRNEFAMFVQAQLNEAKAWKIAAIEWENILADRETKLQADIQEMQHNILGKIEEHFQYVDEERQHNDNMLRQEVSLLISQLAEFQQSQENKGQVQTNDWQKKLEERQTQLIEDVSYIQYVVEEIATRPQNIEAQQKLREKFFMREIAVLKEELASACKTWKSMKKGCMMATTEKESNSLGQEEINISSEAQTRVYEKKRKRGR